VGGLLRRGDHREAAGPRRLDTLPLGGATIPTAMSPIDGSSKGKRKTMAAMLQSSAARKGLLNLSGGGTWFRVPPVYISFAPYASIAAIATTVRLIRSFLSRCVHDSSFVCPDQ